MGPPESKINVEENINFYLKSAKELEKEVLPPSEIIESHIRPHIDH
jgi:hypothetical protein